MPTTATLPRRPATSPSDTARGREVAPEPTAAMPFRDAGRPPLQRKSGGPPECPEPDDRAATSGARRVPARTLSEVRLVRPRVSVIVTCYNYGHWLGNCVESALAQPGIDVDVLVINDASSDDSSRVAHRLAARDRRVRVIDHESNRGHIPSVNEALRLVGGDYIVKLDADDLLTPGSLARSVALLEARPEVGFAYGRALYFGQHAREGMSALHRLVQRRTYEASDHPRAAQTVTPARRWTVWPGDLWMRLVCARAANCISQPEVVMRAATLRAVGDYDEQLPHTSDLAMWLRLASRADVGHVDGAVQGLYRVHPKGMQRTVNAGKVPDFRARLAAFESVLAYSSVPQAGELLRIVRRRLASEALDDACHAYDRGRVHVEPVDAYVAFAIDACRDTPALPLWARLERRGPSGARWSRYYPPFAVEALLRRLSAELRTARWWRDGV